MNTFWVIRQFWSEKRYLFFSFFSKIPIPITFPITCPIMSQTKVHPAKKSSIVLKSVSKQSSIESAWSDIANTSTSDYIAVAVVTSAKDDYVTYSYNEKGTCSGEVKVECDGYLEPNVAYELRYTLASGIVAATSMPFSQSGQPTGQPAANAATSATASESTLTLKGVSKKCSVRAAWSNVPGASTSDYVAVSVATSGPTDYVTYSYANGKSDCKYHAIECQGYLSKGVAYVLRYYLASGAIAASSPPFNHVGKAVAVKAAKTSEKTSAKSGAAPTGVVKMGADNYPVPPEDVAWLSGLPGKQLKMDQAKNYVVTCLDVQITAYKEAGAGAEEMLRVALQSRADLLAYVDAIEKTKDDDGGGSGGGGGVATTKGKTYIYIFLLLSSHAMYFQTKYMTSHLSFLLLFSLSLFFCQSATEHSRPCQTFLTVVHSTRRSH